MANTLTAFAGPTRTTYQAKIVKPDGFPLESNNVNFKFTILDTTGTCIMYAETFSAVNMTSTAGLVSFALGSGVKTYPVSSTTFEQVFSNITPSLSCDAGGPGSISPAANDIRKIVMQFHDGSGWQTLPAMSINAVPYAMYANDSQKLGGVSATSFVQKTDFISCSNGEAVFYNGTSFSCVTAGGGAVTSSSVVAALGFTPVNTTSLTAVTSSVSSTVTSLSNSVSTLSTSVAASFAAIVSSQWATSGTAIAYNSGNVGIGTATPVTKLDVSGGVRISMESATCAVSFAGTLRYNLGNVEYCNGSAWSAFGVAGAGIISVNSSTSATQTFAIGTAGNAPAFVTANGVHTLSIPLASAGSVTGGLVSNADYTTFRNKITSSAVSIAQVLGYVAASSTALENYLAKTNNLSDLASSATARTNLGLGGFATVSSVDLSTASATGILASARLPAYTGDATSVSGSAALAVVGLQGRSVLSTAPTSGQVLAYNGTAWAPGTSVSSQWNTSATTINYMAGKVGIGAAAPITPLHVNGAAIIGSGNTTFTDWNNYIFGYSNSIANQAGGHAGAINVFGSNNAFATANINFNHDSTVVGNSNVVSGSGFNQIFGSNNNLTNAGVTVVLGSGNSATAVQANIVGVGINNNVPNSLMIGANNTAKMTILGSNGNVGIGTTNPLTTLHVVSNQLASAVHPDRAGFILESEGTSVGGRLAAKVYSNTENPLFVGYRARGTKASPSALLSGDLITAISPVGYDGADWQTGAHIRFQTTENWNTNAIGSSIGFRTPSNATSTTLERMRIDHNGNVGIGKTAPVTALDVSGGVRISMESATCATSYAGTIRYNSGSVEYCNGSAWSSFGSGSSVSASTISSTGNINTASNLNVSGSSVVDGSLKLSSMTSGSVLFAGAGGTIAQDNASFFWDDTNNRLGLGTIAPSTRLEVVGTVSGSYMTSQNYSIQGGNGNMVILKSYQDAGGNGSIYIGNSTGGGSANGHNTFFNTVVGHGTYSNNTAGTGNSIFGKSAAGGSSGSYNTIMGTFAAQNGVGDENVLLGAYAGQGSAGTNMYGNVLIGKQAGQNITTGAYNTIIGYRAASTTVGTGSNNILIGYNVGMAVSSTSNFINIGNTIYGSISTGNVGIGTSAPTHLLHLSAAGNSGIAVNAASGTNSYVDFQEAGTKNANIYLKGSDNTFQINDVGTTNTIINGGGGNVGIGITSGAARLTVGTNNTSTSIGGVSAALTLQSLNAVSSVLNTILWTNYDGFANAAISTVQLNSGNVGNRMVLQTKTTSGGAWNAEQLVLGTTGNVGVGVSAPVAKLDVAGEVKFGNSSSTCDAAREGQQRYNSTTKTMQFCNGTVWGNFGGDLQYGGSYMTRSGYAPGCITTNQLTGACSCPSGYTSRLNSMGGYYHSAAWDSVYYGYVCEK